MDFDPSKNFELSQDTLAHAWKNLGEAVIIAADEISYAGGVYPASSEGQIPSKFVVKLDHSFVREHIAEVLPGSVITAATAEYSMPHKIEQDDDEVKDFVSVDWTEKLQGTPYQIDNSIVIRHFVNQAGIERFEGVKRAQHYEMLDNDRTRRIGHLGVKYDTLPEDIRKYINLIADEATADTDELSLDDIEKVYLLTENLRPTH